VIAGYISKKPEVRHFPAGPPMASVRVCESVRFADGSGGRTGTFELAQAQFFRKASRCRPDLEKGDNIYADGQIELRQFLTGNGSKPRTVHEIVVGQCSVSALVLRGNKARNWPAERTRPMYHLVRRSGLKMTGQLRTNWNRHVRSRVGGTLSLLVLASGSGMLGLALAAAWAGLRLNNSSSMPTGLYVTTSSESIASFRVRYGWQAPTPLGALTVATSDP
jgi:single-stranded DNA-binding protein